jgi:hypothetical protein
MHAKRVRKAFLVLPVVVMGLALSGCVWATVWDLPSQVPPPGNPKILIVHKGVTRLVVNNCASSHPSDSRGRAVCALNAVAGLCATQDVIRGTPAERLSPAQCHVYTDKTAANIAAMQTATRDVLNTQGDVCLDYGPSDPWAAAPAGGVCV